MSDALEFTKMHGAGNDFVVLDGIRQTLPPIEPLAQRLCDRHFGIGADQLLVVRPSRAEAVKWHDYSETSIGWRRKFTSIKRTWRIECSTRFSG